MGVSVGSVTEAEITPGADFDAIVGAYRVPNAAPARIPSPVVRARSRRAARTQALIAFGALVVAGIALGASVIVSVELTQNSIMVGSQVLRGGKLTSAAGAQAAPQGVAFGSTTQIGNDLGVTVSDPIAYTPSPAAVGAASGIDVTSTVTVTNLSAGPLQPQLEFAVEGTAATRVFDAPNGIRTAAVRALQPGESATYRVVFAVGDPQKMSVRVSSGADQIIFRG